MAKRNLIIVTGLPGTGKSTVASALAKRLPGRHLNTDIIRHGMGLRGQYDAGSKSVIYDALFSFAEKGLVDWEYVVIDATFSKMELRQKAVDLAERNGAGIFWIELNTSEEEIKKRVSKKREYSEADFEVYLKIKKEYLPISWPCLRLNTDELGVDEMIDKIVNYISGNKSN